MSLLSIVFAAQHPGERNLQFQSMTAILDVFVLSGGLGNEFWALGLDDDMITFLGVHLLPNLSPVVELENSQMSISCLVGWLLGFLVSWFLGNVFLCKRTHSEEHLQQLRARAMMARPETGKKRPLIYDSHEPPG